MDAGRQALTLLPNRIEGVASAKPANLDVVRLCRSERDAILVSIRVSKASQAELAARVGVSKQAMSKWLQTGVPGARVRAFCNATGTTLLAQYHALHKALRDSSGQQRECERIAQLAVMADVA